MARRKKSDNNIEKFFSIQQIKGSALSQYESLRTQALARSGLFPSAVWAWHYLYAEGCLPG